MKQKVCGWTLRHTPCDGEVFDFSFCGTGSGVCRDVRHCQEIPFSWNPNQLRNQVSDGVRTREILAQIADALFWTAINPQLTVKLIMPQEIEKLEYASISFVCGSRHQLEEETRRILYGYPNVWVDGIREVWVGFQTRSEHADLPPRVLSDRYALRLGNKVTEQERRTIVRQLGKAVDENVPSGEYLCHRMPGGSLFRITSYCWQPKLVWITVPSPNPNITARVGVSCATPFEQPDLSFGLRE